MFNRCVYELDFIQYLRKLVKHVISRINLSCWDNQFLLAVCESLISTSYAIYRASAKELTVFICDDHGGPVKRQLSHTINHTRLKIYQTNFPSESLLWPPVASNSVTIINIPEELNDGHYDTHWLWFFLYDEKKKR